MPVAFVPIKPKAFKSDAFVKEVTREATKAKDGMHNDYKKGVSSWTTKVDFNAELIVNPSGGVSITVDVDNEIYTFVHDGTKAHTIKPKKPGGKLRFQGTYTAKTTPGIIQSKSGGPSGEFVYRNIVQHPGTKGRNFTKLIMKKWKPFFQRSMKRALENAAKKSGHSI